MIVVLMGVTASGKTTLGQRLAQRLEWVFVDADDYHTQENKDKMAAGIPLTDADRAPWLAQLNGLLENWESSGMNGVLACSALKQEYREVLTSSIPPKHVQFVFLDPPREVLEEHIQHREHSFMKPSLLDSQIQTLEAPEDAFRVESMASDGHENTVDEEVEQIIRGLGLTAAR